MKRIIIAATLVLGTNAGLVAQSQNYLDLNKNGKMDPYEDPNLDIERRINDLLGRMTVEEKTCQMATLYGHKRVLQDDLPTPKWKNKIWKDGIANIDEHLNGFMGVGRPTLDNPNVYPPSNHAKAMNKVQRFFVEETRLGIPVDFTNEGIRGIEYVKATCFPDQIGMGATFNKSLVRRAGEITAIEARALGFTNVYSPILDVSRDQRWGRFEETYGESPYLVGTLGVEMARGLQSRGVASSPKHFVVYSIPKGGREGMCRTDPHVAPREMEEVHLYPFMRVFRDAGVLGVMCSYNDYDGVPLAASRHFLTERLRDEYGFEGYVVSDSDSVAYIHSKHWVASTYKDAVRQTVLAGMDVRTTFTPPDKYILPLRELIHEGAIPMSVIDERVRCVLRVKYRLGLFDKPYVEDPDAADKIVMCEEHLKVGLQASREAIVLLKNEGDLLPLRNIRSIAVCGPNADETAFALKHYGPLDVDVVTVLDGIRKQAGSDVKVSYTKGCDLVDPGFPESEIFPQPLSEEERQEIDKAVELAKASDVAVVVVGETHRTSGENRSRTSLDLTGRQRDLVQAVHATGTPTVVVLINGRPLSINWTNRYVPAIVEAWFPGSQGGTAIAEVLFGAYNPGGRLSCTFPKTVGQIPMNFPSKPGAQQDTVYQHSAHVGGVLYPFGYGGSYTTFEYSGLKISPQARKADGPIMVECTIKNTGKVAGDEVVQLYTRDRVSSVTTYLANLRGFERIHLTPGESQTVRFEILMEHIALTNRKGQRVVEPGGFNVMIGASSQDIRLEGTFRISK